MKISLVTTELFNAMQTDRQIDMTKLTAVFRNFENAPGNSQHTNHTPRDITYTTPQQLKYKIICSCVAVLGRCFYLVKLRLPSDSNRQANKQLLMSTDCTHTAVSVYTNVKFQKMVQPKMS
jgi:hypothetical protein